MAEMTGEASDPGRRSSVAARVHMDPACPSQSILSLPIPQPWEHREAEDRTLLYIDGRRRSRAEGSASAAHAAVHAPRGAELLSADGEQMPSGMAPRAAGRPPQAPPRPHCGGLSPSRLAGRPADGRGQWSCRMDGSWLRIGALDQPTQRTAGRPAGWRSRCVDAGERWGEAIANA